jgi:tubulin-specific chaperone A
MAPSNPLYIGTQALMRLVDEQLSYHKELEQQTSRLDKLQREQNAHKLKQGEDDGNQDYMVKQQVCLSLIPTFSMAGGVG